MIEILTAEPGSELFTAANRSLYERYFEMGWVAFSERAVVEEYLEHLPFSTMYVALDGPRIVGTARGIDREWDDLPTVAALRGAGLDPGPYQPGVWRDVGGLSLDPAYRGGLLGNELWRLAFADGFANGLYGTCFETHESLVAFVKGMLGPALSVPAPPYEHLGSMVQAAFTCHDDMRSHMDGSAELAWLCNTERTPVPAAPPLEPPSSMPSGGT